MHKQYHYLTITYLKDLPDQQTIVMVDGAVPHWASRSQDYHYDHHRPGDAAIQLLEIADSTRIPDDAKFKVR